MPSSVLAEGDAPAMARPREYPDELASRAVRVAFESKRPIAHVARDLHIHKEALRQRMRQAEADSGRRRDPALGVGDHPVAASPRAGLILGWARSPPSASRGRADLPARRTRSSLAAGHHGPAWAGTEINADASTRLDRRWRRMRRQALRGVGQHRPLRSATHTSRCDAPPLPTELVRAQRPVETPPHVEACLRQERASMIWGTASSTFSITLVSYSTHCV
jgi:hypothetical protein